MNAAVRHGIAALLLMLSAACGGSPTSPADASPPPIVPAPPPSSPVPAETSPSRTFNFARELAYPVSSYTRASRYVLYDSGAFVLQLSVGEYRGRFTEENGVLIFSWDGWSAAGPWGATGTLMDQMLTVRYNTIMQMTDFEDAVYMLEQ